MNYRVVLGVNAGVVFAIGLSLLVPLALSLAYGDGSWASFVVPAAVMLAVGGAGLRLAREPRGAPSRAVQYVSNRDVYLSVTLAWVLAAVLGGRHFLSRGPSGACSTRRSRR